MICAANSISVLSDKHRRMVYDMYGEKGLETDGLEVSLQHVGFYLDLGCMYGAGFTPVN